MEKVNNFLENLKLNKLTDIDFAKLCDWKYLTDPTPPQQFFYEQWIYVIVLFNLFLSITVFQFVSKRFFECKPKYRMIRRVAFCWLSNTILLLLYNLLRVERVSFLSMRLLLVIILVAYVGIILYALAYWVFRLPKKVESFQKARLRQKYMRKK